ncbi:MAG: hypothetical protein F6J98_17445 [Moorea sp. SIO4G2]|nr:hypothetical protein [Moorena sp. SIO4G2]
MKLLSICNPSRYSSPLLDIPIFYQRLALDERFEFFHIPTEGVFTQGANTKLIQVAPVKGILPYTTFLELDSQVRDWRSLEEFDLVFCRTLKPFPEGYLDRLRLWEPFVKFVNSPTGIHEQIQQEFLLKVASKFTPDMVVTDSWMEALTFFEKHQVIVAKRYNSCGGRGVFKIWYHNGHFLVDNPFSRTREFTNFSEVMNYLKGSTGKPLQFVQYLQRVDAGDKRIVVVDGEIYGAYIRRSKSGHWVHNVSVDGECFLSDISSEEKEAIDATFEHYRCRGIHTLGYDFLMNDEGNWCISEINGGNIGGFARLELLTNQSIMERLFTWMIEFSRKPRKNLSLGLVED